MKLQITRPLAFFDLETTGADPSKDRIVQMYFIKCFPDDGEEVYSSLVKPGIPIPAEATAIHGITDQDVMNERSFKDHAPDLFKWLSGCDLGGYNNESFDIPMLCEEFHRAGFEFPEKGTRTIDVFLIEKKVNSRKLAATYKRYTGKDLEDAHDAGADIRATLEILDHQLDKYHELGNTFEDLSQEIFQGDHPDAARRLTFIEGEVCFNFGKYKGEPVKTRPEYVKWMLENNFPADTKRKLREAADL